MKFFHYLVTVGTEVVIAVNIISSVASQMPPFEYGANKPIVISKSSDYAQSTAPSSTPSAGSKPLNSEDIPSRRTPAPNRLNPNPNPLQFPTEPEEVRIEVTDAISLEQALELARRNNRQLQVALLTLERSRANLREAQAAQYPNLSIQAGLNSQGSDLLSDSGNNTSSPAISTVSEAITLVD